MATDDAFSVDEDAVLSVAASGVLGNDSDVDGDALTATKLTDPGHGSVSLQSNGGFIYTPNLNFHGLDSFTYEACDGNVCDSATVSLTVNSVIDAVIDVKQAAINLGSRGVLPLAILSTQTASGELDDFDATLVDISSIRLNGVSLSPVHSVFVDIDGDNDLDLLLHFSVPDLVDQGALDKDSVDIVLTAEFAGGTAFGSDLSGSDSIRIVPQKGKKN